MADPWACGGMTESLLANDRPGRSGKTIECFPSTTGDAGALLGRLIELVGKGGTGRPAAGLYFTCKLRTLSGKPSLVKSATSTEPSIVGLASSSSSEPSTDIDGFDRL